VPGALGECSSARIAVQSECGTRYFPRHGIPVSTDGMSATRVPPSPQARRQSYINSWVFALRKATLLPFLGWGRKNAKQCDARRGW
jgi:hypothetical protein